MLRFRLISITNNKNKMKKALILLSIMFSLNLYAEGETSENPNLEKGLKLRIERLTFGPISTKNLDFVEGDYSDSFSDKLELAFAHGFGVNFGYQHSERLYYGLGVEFRQRLNEIDLTYLTLPIYAEIRTYIPQGKATPYFGAKIGYGVSLKGKESQYSGVYMAEDGMWYYKEYNNSYKLQGLHIEPEIGFLIRRLGLGLSIPISENCRTTEIFYSKNNSTETKKEKSMDLGVHLTISFNFNL